MRDEYCKLYVPFVCDLVQLLKSNCGLQTFPYIHLSVYLLLNGSNEDSISKGFSFSALTPLSSIFSILSIRCKTLFNQSFSSLNKLTKKFVSNFLRVCFLCDLFFEKYWSMNLFLGLSLKNVHWILKNVEKKYKMYTRCKVY